MVAVVVLPKTHAATVDNLGALYHQFRNHLAVFQSLLRLTGSTLESEEAQQFSTASELRCLVIAHSYGEVLSEPDGSPGEHILVLPYLRKILDGHLISECPIRISTLLELDGEERVTHRMGVPLGLLLNEMLLTHITSKLDAPVRKISVSLSPSDDGWLLAVGHSDSLSLVKPALIAGSRLYAEIIRSLVGELGGRLLSSDGELPQYRVLLPERLFLRF